MQRGIVPVRVDYGRLILAWVIFAIVTLAVMAVIVFTKLGVKRGVGPVTAEPTNLAVSPCSPPPSLDFWDSGALHAPAMCEDDVTAYQRYLFACWLLGVAALVLTGLYPPWLGRPLSDAENLSAEVSNGESHQLTLFPAGYGWCWQSYRARDWQAKK